MKFKTLKILVLTLAVTMTLTGCISTKQDQSENPYFLADMNGIYMGELVAHNKQNFFKPKAITIEVYFYPRTSYIGWRFKDGLNKVFLDFDPEEYAGLCDGIEKYLELNTNKTFENNYKPKYKNRFQNGKVNVAWGTTGPGREVEAPFNTNYEWFEINNETNPYFRLIVDSTNYPLEEHVASPNINLYFTPSQAQNIITIIDEETVMNEVNSFNNAAYNFE